LVKQSLAEGYLYLALYQDRKHPAGRDNNSSACSGFSLPWEIEVCNVTGKGRSHFHQVTLVLIVSSFIMAASSILLVLCCVFRLSCSVNYSPKWYQNISTNLFHLPGDIVLGGLFPINDLTSNLSQRIEPNNISCERLNEHGLGLALVMKYAVDEINGEQILLPGIKLGYRIYDSCKQSAIIMKPTISFLTEKSNQALSVECNYTNYETSISAVIGPHSSEMVSVIGKLLGFFLMPQISYGATSDKFSDKDKYPSFFRTVPSDKWQIDVMALLLKEFNWNWVAVVGSEEEYGQQGVKQFSKLAENMSICVAYEGMIPVYSDPEPAVKTIVNNIIATKVGVVVVFSLGVDHLTAYAEALLIKLSEDREDTSPPRQNDIQCTKCPEGQWSLIRSTNCTAPTFDFLSWDTLEALYLTLAGILLLLCQGSVGVVFLKHRSTPMVMASGGALTFVALLSLMGACLSLLLFLGQSGDLVCRLQLPLTSIFQTVALAIITSLSLQLKLPDIDTFSIVNVNMPRGRSARSARSDTSEMDMDGTESEITKLQRQFRIMEGDRQAYNIQAREQIRKQQQEIDKLLKEQEELQRNLCLHKSLSQQQQDSEDTKSLRALLEQRDTLEGKLRKEQECQKELQREISDIELKLAELRKGHVSTSDEQRSKARPTQRAIHTLEYKLDRAMTRFNEQLTTNSRLREELQTLHIERLRFQQLHNRLDKELQEVRRKIGELTNLSTAAYDAKVEAQSKMTMMREKAVKDLAQYNAEMKELERVIAHECSLKEFMSTKCSERSGQDDGPETGHRQLSEVKEQRRTDSGEESLDALEEVFERIQTVTGEDNLDMLVTRFIQVEDRNFALFKFVNEQNNEAESLRDQIGQIEEEREQFRAKGLQQEHNHQSLLRNIDEQQKETECQAEDYENQANIMSKNLDRIKIGVNSTFSKIQCDCSVMEDMLGATTGISENNIMSYLGQIEQKTNELLIIQAYLNSKDLEKDYNPKDLVKFLLGQNPELLQQNFSIQPTLNSVEHDAEESVVTDDEERPLSQGELRKRIMRGVLQKKS
ncbi:hypothetical protein INR49_029765, partial [Caranx melampygus]